jgi:hypothetical protein
MMDLTLLDGKALVLATSQFKVPMNFNVKILTILRGIGKRYGTGRVRTDSKLSCGQRHMNVF